MYFTGTFQDYENRLHQFASNPGPGETGAQAFSGFNNFITEGSGYLAAGYTGFSGVMITGMAYKWEREARLSYYKLSGDGSLLSKSLLSTGIII
jgi:hypothetical protein